MDDPKQKVRALEHVASKNKLLNDKMDREELISPGSTHGRAVAWAIDLHVHDEPSSSEKLKHQWRMQCIFGDKSIAEHMCVTHKAQWPNFVIALTC